MKTSEVPLPTPKPWIRTSASIMAQAQQMLEEAK